jgi:hypothetical protein
VEVGLRNGGIDLEFEPPFFCYPDPPKGSLKGTVHLSKGIVSFRIGTVETDADPLNP